MNFLLILISLTTSFYTYNLEAYSENLDSLSFESDIDQIVGKVMEDWNIPGLAISIVENNKVQLLKGYGVANITTGKPIIPDETIFHVASISKPVTASAALQLHEEGILDLNQPIDELLPPDILKNSYDGSPTTADLLVHAGGFDIQNTDRLSSDLENMPRFENYISENLPPIIHQPGTISVYSNHGYAVIGYLVSLLSEKDFVTYMDEHIFEPLGMNNSSFALRSDLTEKVATGYGLGQNEENNVDPLFIKTVPASMLKTTALDITKWMIAVLNNGSLNGIDVFGYDITKQMLSRKFSNHDLLPGRSYGMIEGARFSPPEYLHSGAVPGFTSAMVLHPEMNFGVFVTANSNSYLWGIINRVLDRIDDELDSPDPELRDNIKLNTSIFDGYYREAAIPQTSIFKFGNWIRQVHIRSLSDNKIEWRGKEYVAIDSLAFQNRTNRSVVAFGKSGGKVRYLFARGDEYVKIPWFQNRIVQAVIFLIYLLTFIYGIVSWLILPLFNINRFKINFDWPFKLLKICLVVNFLFLSSIIYLAIMELNNQTILGYGLPVWFQAMKIITWGSFLIVPALLFITFTEWKNQFWDSEKRTKFSLITIILTSFIPYTFYWNLIYW